MITKEIFKLPAHSYIRKFFQAYKGQPVYITSEFTISNKKIVMTFARDNSMELIHKVTVDGECVISNEEKKSLIPSLTEVFTKYKELTFVKEKSHEKEDIKKDSEVEKISLFNTCVKEFDDVIGESVGVVERE